MQVFHKMDSMLKDATYGAELEALRRSTHDAQPQPDVAAGVGGGASDPDASEEDSQVSTSEALDMLRQVRPTSTSCIS